MSNKESDKKTQANQRYVAAVCFDKVHYFRWSTAKEVMRSHTRRKHVYRCSFCKFIHIGEISPYKRKLRLEQKKELLRRRRI